MTFAYFLIMTYLGVQGQVGGFSTKTACEAAGLKLPGQVKTAAVAPEQMPKSPTKSYWYCQQVNFSGF